jgi:hypothetical protein
MAGLTLIRGIDPKLTEQFLLTQPDVVDASVWWNGDRLYAHVIVAEEANYTRRELQAACLETLGLPQTPHELTLVAARRLAA